MAFSGVAFFDFVDELGVTIEITELDVNAPPVNADYEQGVYFQKLFETVLALKAEGIDIDSVTIWGLTDAGSWRREQTPVVFRGDLSAKPAFQGIVNAKKGGEIEKPADYVEPPKEGDPIKENYEEIRQSDELKKILQDGAERANAIAENTMKRVRENFGLGI